MLYLPFIGICWGESAGARTPTTPAAPTCPTPPPPGAFGQAPLANSWGA